MDMDMGTDSTNTTDTTMMGMSTSLFFSSTTSLYSTAWTPANAGQYAGTCIFLVVLAITFRGLIAAKAWKEAAWMNAEFNRRYVTVVDRVSKAESIISDASSEKMVLSSNGVEENVMVVKKKGMGVRPWRMSVDPVRAVIDTVLAGVGYLL